MERGKLRLYFLPIPFLLAPFLSSAPPLPRSGPALEQALGDGWENTARSWLWCGSDSRRVRVQWSILLALTRFLFSHVMGKATTCYHPFSFLSFTDVVYKIQSTNCAHRTSFFFFNGRKVHDEVESSCAKGWTWSSSYSLAEGGKDVYWKKLMISSRYFQGTGKERLWTKDADTLI